MNLPQLQTRHGRYHWLQLDNPHQLAAGLGLDFQQDVNQALLKKITQQMIELSDQEVSALVLDHEIGLETVTNKGDGVGVLLKLETTAEETNPLDLPRLDDTWGIPEIVNNYGVVKLELYYHPEEVQALQKKQFVAEIADYCRYQQVGLYLQLRLFSPTGEKIVPETFQELQLAAVQELQKSCDILGLDSPQGALAAATLTAELDVPWVVTLHDTPYDLAKEQLREAMESGAQGCVAGDSLWQELYSLRRKDKGVDEERVHQFLTTVLRDRLIEIGRIIGENATV